MSKKSVDEIWKELNAKPAPRGGSISALSGLPGITSKSRTVNASSVAKPAAAASGGSNGMQDVAAGASGRSKQQALANFDPAKAGITAEEVQAYVSTIQRTINCLTDPDRGLRRTAATTLHDKLFKGDAITQRATPQLLQALLCGPLLHPLLTMLSDSVERSRTTALAVLLDGGRQVADLGPLLPALLPELVRRYGALPVQEPAEEIRLQIVDLVSLVVSRALPTDLASFSSDICTVLCRALEDGYHDIKKAGCTCIVTLAARAPAGSLDAHSEKLLQGLVADLQHQHSRVRLAVIQALDALVLTGVPAGQVEGVVAPGVKQAAYDRAPAVREALFTAVAHWLGYLEAASQAGSAEDGALATAGTLQLQQRVVDAATAARGWVYAPALLPLLLLGVTDPQASTAAHALVLVEGVGRAWQAQQQRRQASKEAGPMEVDGSGGEGSGRPEAMDTESAASPSGSGAVAGDGMSAAMLAACQLKPPYSGRPGAGCRAMVTALLPQLLPPLVKELGEWTVGLRAAAARGLHTTLVLAEGAAADHLRQLVPALCSAIGDEDAEVAGHVIACVHVLGAHVAAALWLPLLLDHLTSGKLSQAQKANALVVLSGLIHAAGKAGQVLPDTVLVQLADALASDEVRGAADHPAVRQQLLAVATNTMAWAGTRCSTVAGQLYVLLLQLFGSDPAAASAASAPAAGQQEPPVASTTTTAAVGGGQGQGRTGAVRAAMAQLATCCCAPSFEALADAHADAVIASALGITLPRTQAEAAAAAAAGANPLKPDLRSWTSPDAPAFRIFRALLLTCSGTTLSRLLPIVAVALQPLLSDQERDGTLRVAVLQLVDALLEDPERGPALVADDASAQLLLRGVLLPPLVWHAGKVAAAVRFAAVTAWSTLLGRRLPPAGVVLGMVDDGTLLPLLHQALDEDWYVDMRASACFVTEQLLRVLGPQLGDAPRRAIYPELLKRLDDSSNAVRCAACRALVAFVEGAGPQYCDTNSGYLAAGVIIHMDDSDPGVQEAACSVLEAQAAHKPRVVDGEVAKVRERFRSKHYCDRVAAACEAALRAGSGGAASAEC